MNIRRRVLSSAVLTLLALSMALDAQVTPDRLLGAAQEPQNWLTYSGGYASQRHSLLTQITPANVRNLDLQWILPNQVFGAWQSSPLVVDGIMYVTQRPNDVLAVDAKSGRVFWQYRYTRLTRCARVLRRQQSRRRDARRHAVPRYARRSPRRARREDRALAVECRRSAIRSSVIRSRWRRSS